MNAFVSARTYSRRELMRTSLPAVAVIAGLTGTLPGLRHRSAGAQDATPIATPGAATTPAAERLTWFLAQLETGTIAETDVTEYFSPLYLTAYPSEAPVLAANVVERVRSLAATLGPVTLQDFVAPPEQTPNQAYGLLAGGEGAYLMVLTVEPEEPHRILDVFTVPLLVEMLTAPPAPPATWDEFDQQLAAYAPETSFLAAEIVNGSLQPIHALDADTPLSVGSSYKLYILGELARRIEAGEASWDEPLAIRSDWKSLPAAPNDDVMAYEPTGTEHTLREHAELMIAISGNTAADHLLLHLGREHVEATLAEMGHAQPDLNQPLLTTREFFALNVALRAERAEAYAQATEDERRALLDTEVRPVDLAPVDAIDWVRPRNLDTVGWFASVNDLCAAMADLRRQAGQPGLEPILDILGLNAGIDPSAIDAAQWTYVGHKGGALPGALNRTWLLERADGRTFVMSVTLNNSAAAVDLVTPEIVIAGAFTLLAHGEGDEATAAATPATSST